MEKNACIALVGETEETDLSQYTIRPEEVEGVTRVAEWKLKGGSEGDDHLAMSASACDPGDLSVAAATRIVHDQLAAA